MASRRRLLIQAAVLAGLALTPAAWTSAAAAVLALSPAKVISRFPAPEADQGVAVDARFIYAVDNSRIAKYDRATGAKVDHFKGDPAKFPHLNSCAVIGAELICAGSNYPATPMQSRVEVFDPVRLIHLRTIPQIGRAHV